MADEAGGSGLREARFPQELLKFSIGGQLAMGELRAEVADLAISAASKVVGESLNDKRQRRLVEEFLTEATPGGDRKKR